MDTLTYFLISVLIILSVIVMALVALYLFLHWRKLSSVSQSVQPLDLAVTAATVTVRLEEERISGVEHAPTRYLHRYAKIRV